jgi:hypothetical protein
MLPDTSHLHNKEVTSGKAFTLVTTSVIGAIPPTRDIVTNVQEWDDCANCPEFDSCFKLSLAKTAMKAAYVGT